MIVSGNASSPGPADGQEVRPVPVPSAYPFVVALDGRSGSGKTVLAGLVAAELGRRGRSCTVVHLDDIYPGWTGLAAALPRLCTEVLAPLREGRAARFTSWDWYADRPGPLREVPPTEVVLVEGVGSGATDCPSLVDLVGWLEVDEEVRRRRALQRDGDVFAPHWEEWAAQEEVVFADHGGPDDADLVLHGADAGSAKMVADRVVAGLDSLGRVRPGTT